MAFQCGIWPIKCSKFSGLAYDHKLVINPVPICDEAANSIEGLSSAVGHDDNGTKRPHLIEADPKLFLDLTMPRFRSQLKD